MAEGMGDGQPQPVVGDIVKMKCAPGLKPEASAAQDERDVVVRVRVAFPQFVGPENRRMIQHGTAAARLRRLREHFCQECQLFAQPHVDFCQFLLRPFIQIRIIGKRVVGFIHSQPAHP